MDAYEAVQAWQRVVGAAVVEPLPAMHNPIWKVTGEDGRQWVLKQLPEWPPGASPVDQYRVAAHLQAAGLPVAVPVVTDSGMIAHNADDLGTPGQQPTRTGADAYALIPLLPNNAERQESPQLAYLIGQGIGRLDRLLAECPWSVSSFTDDPGPDVLGDDYAKLPLELRALVDPLREQLWNAVVELPMQLTHGDCNAGNVLINNDTISGYIDLDHLSYGPRIRDLSYYLASRLRDQLDDEHDPTVADVFQHYLAGFHSVHPVTARERAAVVPLLITSLVGGAGWCLHGWVPDPAGYRRNLNAIRWIVPRYPRLAAVGTVGY